MTNSPHTMPRYKMGNVGDLLKHGVLAEFIRWQCELGKSFRFFDLFGGKPGDSASKECKERVLALPKDCALRAAQIHIDQNCYFGSGGVVRNIAASVSGGSVEVLTDDCNPECQKKLREAGFLMLREELPQCSADADHYDAYTAFEKIVEKDILKDDDLVLLDSFSEFLPCKAQTVIPQMAKAARRATVLLFAVNRNPKNKVGLRFDTFLKQHLPCAWRMTCPPMKGELKFHADVVLIARPLLEGSSNQNVLLLRQRLTDFAKRLASILDMPAQRMKPRVVSE